jgi:hypothetical protein
MRKVIDTETVTRLRKLICKDNAKLNKKETVILYLAPRVVDAIVMEQREHHTMIHTIGLGKEPPTIMGVPFIIEHHCPSDYANTSPAN